jgi:hypothetical protein
MFTLSNLVTLYAIFVQVIEEVFRLSPKNLFRIEDLPTEVLPITIWSLCYLSGFGIGS